MPIFQAVSPALDGAAETLGDGTVKKHHLHIPSGEYTTPFWLRLDGNDDRLVKVNALPWDGVVYAGQIEALSSAPTGATWRGQEPAGMTQITSRSYDAVDEDGWSSSGSSNLSIVSRADAPQSPSNVLQGKFPAGMSDNSGAFQFWLAGLKSNGYRRAYYATYFRIPSTWIGWAKWLWLKPIEPDGTVGGTHFIAPHRKSGTSAPCDEDGFVMKPHTQGNQTNTTKTYSNNVNRVVFNYDQWILFETELFFGDPGQANGEWRWWIDGTLCGEHTGEDWFSTGDADTGKLQTISHETPWDCNVFCSGDFCPNPNDGFWEFDESYASGSAS